MACNGTALLFYFFTHKNVYTFYQTYVVFASVVVFFGILSEANHEASQHKFLRGGIVSPTPNPKPGPGFYFGVYSPRELGFTEPKQSSYPWFYFGVFLPLDSIKLLGTKTWKTDDNDRQLWT
jgi:hypothetical protein